MPISKFRPTFTFTQDRLEQLKAIVPEAFADGKINWESLKQAMGEFLEDESQEAEHFGLFWPGKREARRLATMPSKGALVPALGEGINEDSTGNIFIEGENLEVLKFLQKSYAGRIKMIYIDPPYNTGKDFVYKDDYKDPFDDYLKKTKQLDQNGNRLSTNSKTDGRFHSNWLSMVYPRLLLAKNLLKEDGVIFISIDDNELHNLRQIMNELFGEENFSALIVEQTNPRGRTLDRFIAKTHEYLLVFSNQFETDALRQIPKDENAIAEYDKEDQSGKYRELELRNRNPVFNRQNRPNLYYEIYVDPSTGKVSLSRSESYSIKAYPLNSREEEGCWTWGKEKVKQNNDLLVGRQVSTGAWRVFRKDYLPKDGATTKAKSIWLEKSLNHENGKEELGKLFGKTPFDFPKSVDMIKKCLSLGSGFNDGDIALDFFAGSCTAAQAVLELNREDGGNRRFIMVQLPEPTPEDSPARKAGYDTIAEIGKERIRLVIARMKKEVNGNSQTKREMPEDLGELGRVDLGFKVFKLTRSNFRAWEDYEGENPEELEKLFDQAETPLVEGCKQEDLLTEIILQQGFPLDSRITPQAEFKQNTIQLVESTFCAHRLFVCLDGKIKDDTIKRLELRSEDIFVCLDSALTDQAKMRLADVCNLKVI